MRLIIISNRLPVTVSKREGKFDFKSSVGGVATGILTYLQSYAKDMEYVWVGWAGIDVDAKHKHNIQERLSNEYHAHPVFISEKTMNKFYLGFCNKTIWPIFHYFPTLAQYQEDYWEAYEEVNKAFCDELENIVMPGDILWIHDYQFMLLPKMLRERFPKAKIGFFLHIPFPSYEMFRLLPNAWRANILEGILGADLIGFHTHEYSQHFLRCIMRLLGKEHNMGNILLDDRLVKVDTFPMGIDYKKFNESSNDLDVKNRLERLKKTFQDRKVILSIDRLDYTKGIIHRLRGYEKFLEKNPSWHKKVVLVAVVVPSRIGVDKYQDMKRSVEELIGKINGKHGKLSWTPIIYQYKALEFKPLTALYSSSDVALITPLRDGMNLIAKEYIACHNDKKGVLILSEMAGAVKELNEAIIINPNDIESLANAIKTALEMPEDEQIYRNNIMQDRLKRYDVKKWSEDFIKKLLSIKKEQEAMDANYLNDNLKKEIIKKYRNAKKRLIFLDYDGTLAPFSLKPELAAPTDNVINILDDLSKDDKNKIVLISGRDKETLQKWFGKLNIIMIAEHGVWKRIPNSGWIMNGNFRSDWKKKIREMLELHTDRLPGSIIEEKDFSIAWHYRLADSEQSAERIKELVDGLVMYTANMDLQVLTENKVVEIRNSGVNKGVAALEWSSKKNWDFMLAIGDDLTDEDLFQRLPNDAYSIKVGLNQSRAKFNLHSDKEVRKLLEYLMTPQSKVKKD